MFVRSSCSNEQLSGTAVSNNSTFWQRSRTGSVCLRQPGLVADTAAPTARPQERSCSKPGMEKSKAGREKQERATSQGLGPRQQQARLGNCGELCLQCYSRTQLRYLRLSHPNVRNTGKEPAKHYLSQLTEMADHYFRRHKAEAGGCGLGFGFRVWFFCFVGFPPQQLKAPTAFHSQESRHSLRLEAMQTEFISWLTQDSVPSP